MTANRESQASGQDGVSPAPRKKRTRASKPKVRSGCITCKVRRVKCDEGKPACNRCIHTGRNCDGYGRGPNDPANASLQIPIRRKPKELPLPPIVYGIFTSFPGATQQECRIFQRFRDRTIRAFTGNFHSVLWENLTLRVGQQEPAVYHGIMALGTIHEHFQLYGPVWNGTGIPTQIQPLYRLALHHYSSALQQLNDRLARKSASNAEIVLISCVLFICFEILQGNGMATLSHFEGGMSVLQDSVGRRPRTMDSDTNAQSIISQSELHELYHVFSRYDIQASTLQGTRRTQLILPPLDPKPATSLSQAQCHIFNLFNAMYRFVRIEALPYRYVSIEEVPPHLVTRRDELLSSFHNWSESLSTLDEAEPTDPGHHHHPSGTSHPQRHRQRQQAILILLAQEKVAQITLRTSLATPTETVLDSFHADFSSIIALAEQVVTSRSEPCRDDDDERNEEKQDHGRPEKNPHADGDPNDDFIFKMDLGILQPLYFTAIRCRHPWLRRRALDLLKETGTEGIWEGTVVALAAEWVCRREQQDEPPLPTEAIQEQQADDDHDDHDEYGEYEGENEDEDDEWIREEEKRFHVVDLTNIELENRRVGVRGWRRRRRRMRKGKRKRFPKPGISQEKKADWDCKWEWEWEVLEDVLIF